MDDDTKMKSCSWCWCWRWWQLPMNSQLIMRMTMMTLWSCLNSTTWIAGTSHIPFSDSKRAAQQTALLVRPSPHHPYNFCGLHNTILLLFCMLNSTVIFFYWYHPWFSGLIFLTWFWHQVTEIEIEFSLLIGHDEKRQNS